MRTDQLRKKLKESNIETKCVECGISTKYNNKDIILHIDHIDGNRSNNDILNLRYLCPNCHSQTNTWCSKNRQKGRHNTCQKFFENMTDEEILSILQNSNILEMAAKYQLNYASLSRYLRKRNIVRRKTFDLNALDINQVSDLIKNNSFTYACEAFSCPPRIMKTFLLQNQMDILLPKVHSKDWWPGLEEVEKTISKLGSIKKASKYFNVPTTKFKSKLFRERHRKTETLNR
jgi:hypothetical protein